MLMVLWPMHFFGRAIIVTSRHSPVKYILFKAPLVCYHLLSLVIYCSRHFFAWYFVVLLFNINVILLFRLVGFFYALFSLLQYFLIMRDDCSIFVLYFVIFLSLVLFYILFFWSLRTSSPAFIISDYIVVNLLHVFYLSFASCT
uniref:Putative product n=1 Tax=Xenopsylla cheopis TaxID=163159 RepID=A0A6M2DJC8_XENCH